MRDHLSPSQDLVYIVDDDDSVCDSLRALLEVHGHAVRSHGSGADFLADNQRLSATFLIIDQHMPGLDGLDVVAELRRQGFIVPTVLITGRLDRIIEQRAALLGVVAVLEKPYPASRLMDLINRGGRASS